MTYRVLTPSLYATADAVQKYLRAERGITKFDVEAPIQSDVEYCPTLSAKTRDFSIVCVEVSERAYSNPLDAFVLECKNRSLPVKLYVAMPKAVTDPEYRENLKRAKSRSVGLIEVDTSGVGVIVEEALLLSLTGLRDIKPANFPTKYRTPISEALGVFRNGNPSKGCSLIYDEIEQLTRRVAEKSRNKGYWRQLKPGEKKPKINLQNGPWAKVIETLMSHLDPKVCPCPELNNALLARILGITPHRNDSGHKPKNGEQRKKIDSELRTRFENAVDVLSDLIAATKPLRV